MHLRTPTSRVALAGLALVAASSLTACSTGSDERETAAAETGTTAPATVDDTAPEAPLTDVILAEGETPGEGVVQVVDPELLRKGVDKLVADQQKELMVDPACDKVSRLETVSNYATGEGVTAAVRYKQAEDNDTEHRFGIAMIDKRLDDFLNRSLYEACTTSGTTTNPSVELVMNVADAPDVPGAEGFRVTSDFITTQPDGAKTLSRAVAVHGYAKGTTVSVEYAARGDDPAADPVLPTANSALDAIYTAQMEKLVRAQ